ncbi:TrbL/VirB6 plasmid conjugal transfer protein [Ruminococcaceae bacterium P7]|nr:TrbL/VirB6 plasmid conjugal transfer protein [Ruminococcaceae bacterium P7]
MQKNLYTIKQEKRNKRLCKVLSVIFVVLMLLSTVVVGVSAATNVWGLDTGQLDRSYFYSLGYGGGCPGAADGWYVIRQRCFYSCNNLTSDFNQYVVDTDINCNAIKQLNYCYNHDLKNEAVALSKRWNELHYQLQECITETRYLCGTSTGEKFIRIDDDFHAVTMEQYQTLFNEISSRSTELSTLIADIKSLYSFALTAGSNAGTNAINNSKSLVNQLWSMLGKVIIDFGSGNGSSANFLGISVSSASIETAANSLSALFKTFAYAIAVILFGVNITTTSLQNEILTLRGGIKVFARVILVKFWIDLAIPICIYVLNIFNSIATQLMTQLSVTSSASNILTENFSYNTSSSGVFEIVANYLKQLIEWFKILITASPLLIVLLVMAVCIIIVMVKMVARVLELTCLTAVAPVFFATLVGEESKRYFRKFISAFLSTAGYIIFVTITYALATKWVANASPSTVVTFDPTVNVVANTMNVLPRAIIIIACCRVVVKPPKVFTSLLDG